MGCSNKGTGVLVFVMLVMCAAFSILPLEAGVDLRAWDELDIVPMPKNIKLTDRDLELSPGGAALVIGPEASRQSRIGADWINRRLEETGGKEPLPVVSEGRIPGGVTAVIIGTVTDNPLIARAVRARAVDVGYGNPGERGYEIRRSSDGSRIYLAGADDIGVLYACVTFGELLEHRDGGVYWRAAEVRDWPDFLRVGMRGELSGSRLPEIEALVGFRFARIQNQPPSPEFREEYLRLIREAKDRLLRRKVSEFQYVFAWEDHRDAPDESLFLVREGVEYGIERGIAARGPSEAPFVGLKKDYPDVESELRVPWGRYAQQWIRGWAPRYDEIRVETARSLAEWVKKVGFTDVHTHDTDTGGYHNPAQWEERGEESRERWGADYAAATAHKHMIYYKELKSANPGLRIHFTLYPYNITALVPDSPERMPSGGEDPRARERIIDTWRSWGELMPDDVTFCIRENTAKAISVFRELWPHGLKGSQYVFNRQWGNFLNEDPSFAGQYFRDKRDKYSPAVFEFYVPLRGLAAREYSWNVNAPGAGYGVRLSPEETAACRREARIYQKVYPRVVRNLFGRGAAPDVWEAVKLNIAPNQIFEEYYGRGGPNMLETLEKMNSQAELARRGAEALDRVQEGISEGAYPCMDERGRFYHAYLREVFHTSKWTAQIRARKMEAVELARAGDVEEAQLKLEEAEALVEAAGPALARILAERPSGLVSPVRRKFMADGAGSHRWAEHHLGLDALAERIELTMKELPDLARPIPARTLEALAEHRIVRALRTEAGIEIDGRLNEPEWAGAWPAEVFFISRPPGSDITYSEPSRAYTRGRLMYDEEHLYVGFESWYASGAPEEGREDETVEIFLRPPVPGAGEGMYVQFIVGADGSVRQQRVCACDTHPGRWIRHDDWRWECEGLEAAVEAGSERWTAELKIPLREVFDGDGPETGWTVNLSRYAALARSFEWSSTQAPGSRGNHDVDGFRQLIFTSRRHSADVQLEPHNLNVDAVVFPEGVAAVATFALGVNAGRVLNDVVIRAETYGPDGEKEGVEELVSLSRIYYGWESSAPHFGVRFGQLHKKGGIRILLESAEGEFARWIRFGGWEGVPGTAGSIYAPGRGGRTGLAGECYFPDRVEVGGGLHELLNSAEGTAEFWFKPFRDRQPRIDRGDVSSAGRHALLHYGPVRGEHPGAINNSPLSIVQNREYGRIYAGMFNRRFAGWRAATEVFSWPGGQWRHAAVVWQSSAAEEDRLRAYIDGKRMSGAPGYQRKDLLPDVMVEMLETTIPYGIQVGSLNSTWFPMEGVMDALRISRVARYDEDFTPADGGFDLDNETSLMVEFDGNLKGRGMTSGGVVYDVTGTAGCWAFR